MSQYTTPRPLQPDDQVEDFACGQPALDDYLHKRAWQNHTQGASRCFVTCRDGRVVGYYALASSVVYHQDVAGRIRRNMPDPIPVVLLSRLAIDRTEQGQGLGKHLLRDAILRTIAVADMIGVRAMLVHALDEQARNFYLHWGFELSPTDGLHLLLLLKTARAMLTEPQ